MNRRDVIKALAITTQSAFLSSCASNAANPILAVKPAPDLPAPLRIPTNGIEMAVYRAGSGTPVVFCHGFPELAYSWRHQFHSVVSAGFQAIAPDLRGYGLTDRPNSIEGYTTPKVCDDLIGMMDAFGIEKAIFCGHDWGGFLVDTMPVIYPERCAGIIGVGASNNQRPPGLSWPDQELPELVDKEHWNQTMQRPGFAESLLDGNAHALFGIMFNPDYFNASRLASLPVDSPERSMDLARMLTQTQFFNSSFVSETTFRYYVDTFNAKGFSGGLNWYRAMEATWREIDARAKTYQVEAPYLYIWPEQDPIARMGLDNHMEDYVADLEKYSIENCGHFVMEEKPSELSALIVDWLERKYANDA